jgi:uncharacterized Zn-finger protein
MKDDRDCLYQNSVKLHRISSLQDSSLPNSNSSYPGPTLASDMAKPRKARSGSRAKDCERAQFLCELCQKTFKWASHLKRHIETHLPTNTFKCEVCEKVYRTEHDLSRPRHKSKVHEKPKPKCLKSKDCGKMFRTKQELEHHLSVHTGEKPFPCHLCGTSFLQRSGRNSHLLSHTK